MARFNSACTRVKSLVVSNSTSGSGSDLPSAGAETCRDRGTIAVKVWLDFTGVKESGTLAGVAGGESRQHSQEGFVVALRHAVEPFDQHVAIAGKDVNQRILQRIHSR